MLNNVSCCAVSLLAQVSVFHLQKLELFFENIQCLVVSQEIKSNSKLLKPVKQNEGMKFEVISGKEIGAFDTGPSQMPACSFIQLSLLL